MKGSLEPEIERILPLLPLKDPVNLTPTRAREELVAMADARKDVPLPQPAAVIDLTVDGAAGTIPARMYRASAAAASVVFFHGGGWVAGDLYTHDRNARALALALDAVVLSVDYRRPPEVRFPGAFDDASVALGCRDEGLVLKAQLLVYPATDVAGVYKSPGENAKYPSRAQNAEGYFL